MRTFGSSGPSGLAGRDAPINEAARRSSREGSSGPERHISNSSGDRFSASESFPQELAELRFHRAVGRLHALGPRATAELLAKVGAQFMIRQPIEALLRDYVERLNPETLRRVGADRFPPLPIHGVEKSP
jgi:hypothetical protein